MPVRGTDDASPTAVPHDPAPITATRSLMAQEPTAAPQTASALHPYTVPVPRADRAASAGTRAAPVDALLGPEVVLIPVKAFHQAKRRLGSALADPERIGSSVPWRHTSWRRAYRSPSPWSVTTRAWRDGRRSSGATVMWEPGQGLNGAVRAGVDAWPVPARAG